MDTKRKQAEKIARVYLELHRGSQQAALLAQMPNENLYRALNRQGYVWIDHSRCWMLQHGLFEAMPSK